MSAAHGSAKHDTTSPASGSAQAMAIVFLPFTLFILVGLELLGNVPTPIHFLFGGGGEHAAAAEKPAH